LTCNTSYSNRLVRACDDLWTCTTNRTLTTNSTTACAVNWTCWTANSTATTTTPSTNLCTNWNATSVTTNTTNYTWSCNWANWWTNASCSAPRQYTITFDWNWATSWSMTSQNIQANTSANLTSNWFSKTWFNFLWWNTNKSATTATHTNQASYTIWTANVILYAIWASSCPFDQCLTNWYYVASSSWPTWYNSCAIDVAWYDKTKCILKITSVAPSMYVAPSNSDTTWYHWDSNQSSTCTSLTETCSNVKTYNAWRGLSTTTSWYAVDYCNQLHWSRYSKNIPLPSWMTQWFLPPRDTWWLQTIQQNISKVHHVWGSSWYWSSSFGGLVGDNYGWWVDRLDTRSITYRAWSGTYRVRCIAK
jgi:hypothetical protein